MYDSTLRIQKLLLIHHRMGRDYMQIAKQLGRGARYAKLRPFVNTLYITYFLIHSKRLNVKHRFNMKLI